jgi:cell division protease FtsH
MINNLKNLTKNLFSKKPWGQFLQNILLVFLILLTLSALFSIFSENQIKSKTITLTELVNQINEDKVEKITVKNEKFEVVFKDKRIAEGLKEKESSISQTLLNLGADKEKIKEVSFEIKEEKDLWTWLGPLLYLLFPFLILGFFFWLIFRQARNGAMRAFDFTKARARFFGAGGESLKQKVTFEDVAGMKEAKEEVKEVVDFLKNPAKYLRMGAQIPRGVLLVGPPGCGKTLLAKAIATESGVPFFSISGSEFIELFVGIGASRVRDLFSQAKRAGRAIIFIDEIDSIGRIRGFGVAGAHEEREQTLNQILAEMDGFEKDDGRIIIAATNRPDVLDPALLRPGRFDRRIVIDLPDVNEREEILKIHSRGKPLQNNVSLREIAERTPGFSGADLANLMNEAALLAARKNKPMITQEELVEAIEKVLLGPERKSHILSAQEKKIAAFHEAGHALVGELIPNSEPIRKISIVSRGLAAGYTLKVPTQDKKLKSKKEFLADLAMLLGGYCAEELIFGDVTTGAANDLVKASEIARKMVKELGMSSLGPLTFGEREQMPYLGADFGEIKNYSEKIAHEIDKEVAKLIESSKKKAMEILSKNKKLLKKLAEALIEKETIEREEFKKIIGKE